MSAVEQILKTNRESGRGTLVGYFPAGYPTVEDSAAALIAMAKNGCDVLNGWETSGKVSD